MTASVLVCGAGVILLVAIVVSIGLYETEVDEMIAALDRAAEEKHHDE